jgi:putative transposase
MNPPKCDDLDYIHFLIAAQKVFTCTEAARCAPEGARWPTRPSPACCKGSLPTRRRCGGQPRLSGLLVLEDKPYARQMERVTFHRSGKQRRVVQGIALMTLLQGQALLPLVYRRQSVPKGIVPGDFRVYDWVAAYVRMDSWYASLQNLKQIAALGWRFLTRLKHNRLVNPDGRGDRPIEAVAVPPEGRAVHLKGFGFVGRGRGVLGDR